MAQIGSFALVFALACTLAEIARLGKHSATGVRRHTKV
jgi:hypothetical protein